MEHKPYLIYNGKVLELQKEDTFVVTGFLYNSKKRFKPIHTDSLSHALGINLWKGNVWLVRNKKRIKIKSVNN